MDYKKAYETALARARGMYESRDDAELAAYIFPELAESEDENLKNKSGYYKAGKFWKASTLWNAVKDKTPQRVPNRYILQECTWNIGTLQRFADEIKNVQEVSLDYPIILDINGNILDGAHRVVKAYLDGKDIDVVYIGDDEWPEPDYDEEKAVRESEDERIRKAVVSLVYEMKGTYQSFAKVELDKMVAWLEKQKEQKPAEWSEEDVKRLYSIGTQIGFLKGKYSEYQKDIDWLYALAEKMGFHKCKTGEVITEWKKEDIDDKMLSKPKQEWSEEDEKMMERLITRLNWITYNTRTDGTSPNITFLDEIVWLKSLRPQPKIEWSEDEERLINTSISFLKDFADKGYENAVECIDWLKSKLYEKSIDA